MTTHSQKTFRLRGIPEEFRDAKSVRRLIGSTLTLPDVASVKIRSVALSPYDSQRRIATLNFVELPPALADESKSEWEFQIRYEAPEDDDESLSPDTLTFDTHFVGFTPLHRNDDGDCSFDCVALSGLNGHAFGSFKRKAGLFMWLRDGLPIDIPAARILIYGYDTKLVNSTSFQNLQDLGRSLFTSIENVRTNAAGETSARPLVLIGHSLGGLVIKEGIIALDQSDKADRITLHSIRSIYFFGVPHEGMAVESLIPLVRGQPNEALLHTLDKNSVVLKRHKKEFPTALQDSPPEIVAFYETMKSPTAHQSVGRWRTDGPLATLVDTTSAISGCKKQCPINRDHSEMVKFLGRDDGPYQTVVRHFRNLIRGSDPTLGSAAKEKETPDCSTTEKTYEEFSEQKRLQRTVEEESMLRDCLRSLAFPEQDSRMIEILPEKTTCDWLSRDLDYQKWTAASRGMVWIKGKPGAGKSTVMKYAYEESRRLCQNTHELVLGFFIHGRGTPLQKTPLGIFRALLNKMLYHPEFEPYLQELAETYKDREERMGHYAQQRWSWTEADLRTFMASVFPRAAKIRPITLYIDALDELGEEAATRLVYYLENLLVDVELSESYAKICFSCRNYPIIRLDDGCTIHVDHHNFADVSLVVHGRLARTNLKPEAREKLENEIAKGAQGVFQWAILVVQRATEMSRRGTKAETIMKVVREIPTELDDLYAKILMEIPKNERLRTLKLFQWVCFAVRPLELDEMRYAMAADAEMPHATMEQLEKSENFNETAQDAEVAINHLSRGLIEVKHGFLETSAWEYYDILDPVQFIHQSVSDYILGSGIAMLQGTHSSSSPIGSGHYNISRSCLRLIALRIAAPEVQDKPLWSYAADYTTWHLRCVEDENIAQKDLPRLLAWMNDPQNFSTLNQLSHNVNPFARRKMYRLSRGSGLWHAFAAWGISSAVDTLEQMGDPYISSVDAYGDTPFKLSVKYGQEAVALKLVQLMSAKVDQVGLDSMFHHAVSKGLPKLVPCLLQHGANVNSRKDFRGWTAMHQAASQGYVDIVHALLEAGASPHPMKNGIMTPIVRAAMNGRQEVVKVLFSAIKANAKSPETPSTRTLSNQINEFAQPILEMLCTLQERCAGYEQDASTEQGRKLSPLSQAARYGDGTTVRLLLLLDSSHKEIDGDRLNDRSPLSYVAQSGHVKIARMLLPTSDVEERDSSGRTPLMYSIEHRRLEMMRFLLTTGNANTNGRLRGIRHTSFTKAICDGDEEVIRVLLSSPKLDVDPRKEEGHSQTSAFFRGLPQDKAAAKRDIRGFMDWARYCVDFPMTPILCAAAHGKTIIADMLLETGRISNDSLSEAYLVAESYDNVELMELIRASHEGYSA